MIALLVIAIIWLIGTVSIFVIKQAKTDFERYLIPKYVIAICAALTLVILSYILKMQLIKEIF